MSDKHYNSQFTGAEIDEEIKYSKEVVRNKIPKLEENLSSKADEDKVVKYSEKNIPNGYAGLDENGKVNPSLLYGGDSGSGQGYSPYIGENGNWFEWNDASQIFVDTGVKAEGYTPVRGIDYWTEEDKAEIKAYVDEAILGGEW